MRELISIWEKGEISSQTYYSQMSKTLTDFDQKSLTEFLESIELETGFTEFANYCHEQKIELKILSDGLDIYIQPLLEKYKLSDLSYYSNKVKIDSENNFLIEFPFTDEECHLCGNCKRNHVINGSSDDDFTIYIGDGHSDKCAAQFCDFIFAKGALLKYCEINRITYFPFNDFFDITKKIDELKKRKRLKKKLRAELKRKELYKQG